MGQLGSGRCACGSGLRLRKCCGLKNPLLEELPRLSVRQIEIQARETISFYPEAFREQLQLQVSASGEAILVTVDYLGKKRVIRLRRDGRQSQARALVAAHLERFALELGVETTP